MPIALLDIILIGIMVISGLLALMRGFTREVLSILAWAGAAVAAYLAYPALKPTARQYIQPDYLADIALVAGVFLVVLVVVSLLTMRISDWILDSGVGPLDRTLGFLFGLARGLLLVVVAYLFFIWLVPRDQHPEWVSEARSLPVVEDTGKLIISFLPPDIADTLLGKTYMTNGTAAQAQPGSSSTTKSDADSGAEDGYKTNERRGLDQLLDGSGEPAN
ncbi:CvpA family protein [Kaustia mangrovi]|uniref:CvpA family protein n=1 Tax=Kaustia mangrovi TaxID=2593653 RepID=A0A7S8C779_9HYPH|nr:CvpA family protein [Kaustia mangrovi]QPC44681.1 CvpA family protein [Kaustia mangrovi]